ncbi:hypothetical protein GCM10007890_16460 [Methylobacterium tardum]|uniref:Uncharacterized protein n=1 Tax=Methylobacterium tardum TaxID=374432 RepID=A0AA37TKH2_9HYPH|nr:hypothetical protein GCM10007890_16460 [Methylobacterium tardum]
MHDADLQGEMRSATRLRKSKLRLCTGSPCRTPPSHSVIPRPRSGAWDPDTPTDQVPATTWFWIARLRRAPSGPGSPAAPRKDGAGRPARDRDVPNGSVIGIR